MGGTRPITANSSGLALDDEPATMNARSVSDVTLAAIYKRRCRGDMQVQPFVMSQEHKNHRHVSSVDRMRQEIPIALLADKKRRTGPVRGRTRLGSAHRDKVRHRRYRGGREKDGLGDSAVMSAHPSTATVTHAQEEAGTVWPTRSPERICKVFTNDGNLAGVDQRIAQQGSVPQS